MIRNYNWNIMFSRKINHRLTNKKLQLNMRNIRHKIVFFTEFANFTDWKKRKSISVMKINSWHSNSATCNFARLGQSFSLIWIKREVCRAQTNYTITIGFFNVIFTSLTRRKNHNFVPACRHLLSQVFRKN